MQYLSADYKSSMKAFCREATQMKIYIGLINHTATEGAKVQGQLYTHFSDLEGPINNVSVAKRYATYEENFFRVDGGMYFLPGHNDFYNSGIITHGLCTDKNKPEIHITFQTETEEPVDLKGLTIDFGPSWPTSFEIETDHETFIFRNDKQVFVTEEVFKNTYNLTLRALSMSNGEGRFRIEMITFGIGIIYDNNKIISGSLKSSISPISENMPTTDFSLVIENSDKYFNVDNNDSALNFMETGQLIEVYFGQMLSDMKIIEWQKGATLSMKEWDANDKEATFTAVDRFEYMQEVYRRGKYHESGITLYEMAMDVFSDAGIPEDEFWIDPYLRKVTVYNPLPMVEHKICLQLIANAGRSVMMQNRDGAIIIKSSFIPEISISANQETAYSNVNELLAEDDEYVEYASYEEAFHNVSKQQIYLPAENKQYHRSGYVSSSISDENGGFDSNPIITITFESAYTFFGVTLLFGSIQPEKFVIRTFNNGTKKGIYASRNIEARTVVSYDFIDIDVMEIEFTKAKPYNRIHLKRIIFGSPTDYEMTYNDLLDTPKGKMLEKVKELHVVRTIYTRGTELKDITQEEIVFSGEPSLYEYEFGNPVHNLSVVVLVEDSIFECGASIIEENAYFCRVKITSPPSIRQKGVLTIRGYEYSISSISKKRKLNNAGKVLISDNPLISSEIDADNALNWVGDYYKSPAQYELQHRGEPALDVNDLFRLESRYKDNLMVRAEEHETIFNGGGLSGKTVARREEI